MHIHTHTYTHTYLHSCMHTYIHTYMNAERNFRLEHLEPLKSVADYGPCSVVKLPSASFGTCSMSNSSSSSITRGCTRLRWLVSIHVAPCILQSLYITVIITYNHLHKRSFPRYYHDRHHHPFLLHHHHHPLWMHCLSAMSVVHKIRHKPVVLLADSLCCVIGRRHDNRLSVKLQGKK